MKTAHAILTVALALSLTGCVVRGKPKAGTPPAPQPAAAAPAPAPAPQSLSLPQTQVQLPPVQPVDPNALTPAPSVEAPTEAPPPSRSARPRPRPPAAPAAAGPEPVASPVTPPEPERGPARELLPPAESKRLKNSADSHKHDVRAWLNSSRGRRLDPNDATVARIKSFLKESDDAEERGDMRQASDLADRALILMRELQSGR